MFIEFLGTGTTVKSPEKHCVKSVQIRSFFWSVFPVLGLNMEIYGVNLRIQLEFRKIRTRKDYVFGHFSRSTGKSVINGTKYSRMDQVKFVKDNL